MPLWGTTAAAATNKPKFLPNDVNSKYDVTKCYADNSGWVQRAGTSATGNGNTGANPEVSFRCSWPEPRKPFRAPYGRGRQENPK